MKVKKEIPLIPPITVTLETPNEVLILLKLFSAVDKDIKNYNEFDYLIHEMNACIKTELSDLSTDDFNQLLSTIPLSGKIKFQ